MGNNNESVVILHASFTEGELPYPAKPAWPLNPQYRYKLFVPPAYFASSYLHNGIQCAF